MRLVEGESRCDGRLEEAITTPAWRRVPVEQWKRWDVDMVCAVLGCGLPKEIYTALGMAPTALTSSSREVDVVTEEMDVVTEEMYDISGMGPELTRSLEETEDMPEEISHVLGMGPAPSSSPEEMVIVCSGGCPEKGRGAGAPSSPQPGPSVPAGSRRVRLAGGAGRCAGGVEVYAGGTWSSVCQERWDLRAAAVVCRELGCGAALEAPGSARFGPGPGTAWPYVVECAGSEESLWECPRSEGRECERGAGAGAVCSAVPSSSGPAVARGTVPVPSGQVARGTVPVAVVLCVVLGTLLCLALGALAVLMCRARAWRRGPGRAVGAIPDAIYEELDYSAMPEYQEVPSRPGSPREGSVKKLLYYTGDSVEGSDTGAAPVPAPPALPGHGTPDGYDDAMAGTSDGYDDATAGTLDGYDDAMAGTLDGYDDAMAVPEESPTPSTGDISEGVAQRGWICVPSTGGSCPTPSPPGATRDPPGQPPGHTDCDDVGAGILGMSQ
ncbi:soluble scavenger receptor cysteine-rich domain-containing protein SSC5D-like [Pseudopipra pipra]|uniref:soluble scavenger receptor cysteine-rich domain-containing protein SSC5D-like n=1 Tax=Pseudopipra pipra TaxID=415032 RepID=UPI003139D8DC